MIGGFDRYYQIATCWRDEDLRADRQFEFRQLDLEMAFAEREDVLDVLERCVVASFEALGREPPARPFPRLSYAEAMLRYGTDKPDLRFGLEIQDATEVTRGSEFGVFANAPAVRYLVVPQEFSRAELGRLEEVAKEWGAKGLAYLVYDEEGEVRSPIAKFLSQAELDAFAAPPALDGPLRRRRGGDGRARARLAPHPPRPRAVAGRRDEDVFHWVVDFPLFERDEDDRQLDVPAPPVHRADRRSRGAGRERPRRALSQHYDLIWNGWELGSGSIRIHRADLQAAGVPDDGDPRRGGAGEVRLPAGGAARWARRRTAGSRWGSSASWRCSRASRTSAR